MKRVFLILALCLPLGSCIVAVAAVAAAAVFGAVKYTENGVQRDFNHDLASCYDAAKAGMKETGYAVPDEAQPGPAEGRITVGDTVVTLTREPGDTARTDDDFTRVICKVSTFDTDETRRKAKLIMDAIARHLGEPID